MCAQDPPESYIVQIYCTGEVCARACKQEVLPKLQKQNLQYFWNEGLGNTGKYHVILLLLDGLSDEEEVKECLRTAQLSETPVIAIWTEERNIPFYKAWELLGYGVQDIILLRQSQDPGLAIKARLDRWNLVEKTANSPEVNKILVGGSKAWGKWVYQVVEMAIFSSAPILVTGESGTGKELVARLIHQLDGRKDKQGLTLLDCTTIVPELSGSEFFGHEKGAFTNAVSNRDGAFALADRGTLFLDEIGELPQRLQAELLRVIQEGTYKRVGSNIWQKTNFRLVCATHRVLEDEVSAGRFRMDLYYRLRSSVIYIPPLRKRKLDIPELASFFLGQALNTETPPPFDPLVMSYLLSHDYPGNVRELRQLVFRIASKYAGSGMITLGDIPESDREALSVCPHRWKENGFRDALRKALSDGVGLKDIKRIAGEVAMDLAVEEASGNIQEAARQLNVTDRLIQGYIADRKLA
jgi:transcriptional regulator with GAF, ATPase, and Fis domain